MACARRLADGGLALSSHDPVHAPHLRLRVGDHQQRGGGVDESAAARGHGGARRRTGPELNDTIRDVEIEVKELTKEKDKIERLNRVVERYGVR